MSTESKNLPQPVWAVIVFSDFQDKHRVDALYVLEADALQRAREIAGEKGWQQGKDPDFFSGMGGNGVYLELLSLYHPWESLR